MPWRTHDRQTLERTIPTGNGTRQVSFDVCHGSRALA
jgi:hypothetical protein